LSRQCLHRSHSGARLCTTNIEKSSTHLAHKWCNFGKRKEVERINSWWLFHSQFKSKFGMSGNTICICVVQLRYKK
jgi:hypothetical protein